MQTLRELRKALTTLLTLPAWVLLILLLVVLDVEAQTTYSSNATASAYSYGQWSLAGQAANTYTFTPTSLCNVPVQGGGLFAAFSRLGASGAFAPVYINDTGTPTNSEVVTPTAILSCGVTISPVHSHTTFNLQSATAGLQDTLNVVAPSAVSYPFAVLLDRNWYAQAQAIPGTTPAAIIAAAKGTPAAFLEDVTTAAHAFYIWNGTAYVTGTWTNALPPVTVGAAAGTSPAISDSGTAMVGTVQLTTGTAPATGTLFTLTWTTTGSFLYAPACTVQSIGGTSFTTFTTATAYSSQATATVTATAAPTASTVYLFSFSCK
jgi:hypothetical protein